MVEIEANRCNTFSMVGILLSRRIATYFFIATGGQVRVPDQHPAAAAPDAAVVMLCSSELRRVEVNADSEAVML